MRGASRGELEEDLDRSNSRSRTGTGPQRGPSSSRFRLEDDDEDARPTSRAQRSHNVDDDAVEPRARSTSRNRARDGYEEDAPRSSSRTRKFFADENDLDSEPSRAPRASSASRQSRRLSPEGGGTGQSSGPSRLGDRIRRTLGAAEGGKTISSRLEADGDDYDDRSPKTAPRSSRLASYGSSKVKSAGSPYDDDDDDDGATPSPMPARSLSSRMRAERSDASRTPADKILQRVRSSRR